MDASFDDDNNSNNKNNNTKQYLCNGDEEHKTLKIPYVAKSGKIKLLITSPKECLNT